MTWELISGLQVTDISLKFFRQFDQNIEIGTYRKGSEIYESLTLTITSWAERTILFLSDHTPDDYVLTLAIDKTTGEPVGPRGAIHPLSATLSVYGAYNGLIPPSWTHGGHSTGRPWNDPTTVWNDNFNVGFGVGNQFVAGWGGRDSEASAIVAENNTSPFTTVDNYAESTGHGTDCKQHNHHSSSASIT
jgi:hypothetical protein